MNAFKLVEKNELCLGCGACALLSDDQAIQIKENAQGFLRPTAARALSESELQLFERLCPGLEVHSKSIPDSDTSELWGPIESLWLTWSNNSELRYKASSGGGVSEVAIWLLENGTVDAVLHTGTSSTDPLRNTYKVSTCRIDVEQNAGSRYSPAAPLLGLPEAIQKYHRIALIGKPCDIVAAKKLAQIRSEIKNKLVFFISFMCAGTPSHLATEKTVRKLGFRPEEISTFRYRGNGWPGSTTATTLSGASACMSYKESWGGILNKQLQLRCKICIDGTGEQADVTFGDAWHGTADGYPDFSEQDGRSLAIARTGRGHAALIAMEAAKSIQLTPLPPSALEAMQPYQASRKRLLLSRLLAMKTIGLQPPKYPYSVLIKLAAQAGIRANITSFAGMLRRAIKLRSSPQKQQIQQK